MRRAPLIAVGLLLAGAALWWSPPARRLRSAAAAQRLYGHAVSLYMINDLDGAAHAFRTIAERYHHLPIGAMARLKLAFLVYDADDNETPAARATRLDRAEELFNAYLGEHPQSVMYLSNSPMPDYEGELEIVAWYFLGRIAGDRGDTGRRRMWYEKVARTKSRNPGNMIVSKVTVLLREMDHDGANEGAPAE